MTEPDSLQPLLSTCPLCDGRQLHYAFSKQKYRVVRCAQCRLMLLNPQPSDEELRRIYTESYFLGDPSAEGRRRVSEMRRVTARRYLQELARYRGRHGGRLLEIGCGEGDFLSEAERVGYRVTGVEVSPFAAGAARARVSAQALVVCGDAECLAGGREHFDVCVLSDVLEHVRNPFSFLTLVRGLLTPGGVLLIATPSLDSWSARLLRENWMEFKPEHLFYFDANTIQHALFRTGFDSAVVGPGWKTLNLEVVAHHFERFPTSVFTPLVNMVARFTPAPLRRRNVRVVASGLLAFARKRRDLPRPRLSVIVPAYNEVATLDAVMRRLLEREQRDVEMEIVLVESGSTDGTRELARRYAGHPRVKVVLEDRPQGKGRAVRTGFTHATGDFVLIQDADLEYDVEDYDVLLEPLLNHREAFVLGSRHGGSAWKMRQFAGQRLLSVGLNLGHWLFTMLINVLFSQRLRDPFTMYKVFRRDCLYGLRFECNRFDFDYELVIKLIRKGYRPIEIPVNYRSRTFGDGKKVSIWRDPPLWLWALVKLRAARIDPMREVERERRDLSSGLSV
jgi:glycosyltransferase involved in cell wall biosynthesis/SAM-dependent methyltransferase